jgi:hypothetical protein
MTPAEKQLYLDFLQAKLHLLTDNPISRQGIDMVLTDLRQRASCRKQSLKHIESDLHECFGPDDPAEKREIDRQLMERFGFSRIGADPVLVSRRVLKRGRIKTLEELETVRNLIADQGNIATLGTETHDQLALLLDQKEAEAVP